MAFQLFTPKKINGAIPTINLAVNNRGELRARLNPKACELIKSAGVRFSIEIDSDSKSMRLNPDPAGYFQAPSGRCDSYVLAQAMKEAGIPIGKYVLTREKDSPFRPIVRVAA